MMTGIFCRPRGCSAALHRAAHLHVRPRRVGKEDVLEPESSLDIHGLGTLVREGVDVERLVREAEDLGGGLLALSGVFRIRADLKRKTNTE